MALTYWTVKENDHLLTDELIGESLSLLQERLDKLTIHLKEKYPEKKCKECGANDFKYTHNRAICKSCGFVVEKKIPHIEKAKLGCASTQLYSVIKEMFAIRLAGDSKNAKPTSKQLRKLKFSISSFDSGEYSVEEVEYLTERYNSLIEGENISSDLDKFMVRSLVIQELRLQRLLREEAVGNIIDTNDKTREFKIYNDLTDKLKMNRSKRDSTQEESIMEKLYKQLEENTIEDELDDYHKNLEKREKLLKESKKRREEVGNEF